MVFFRKSWIRLRHQVWEFNMKKYTICYFILFIGSLLGYFFTLHWCWLILAGVLVFSLVMAQVFLQLGYRGLDISYQVTDTCIVNQQIPLFLQLRVDAKVPLGKVVLSISYKNLVTMEEDKQLIQLEQGREKENRYELPYAAKNCGKIHITVDNARCYDMLGLFYRNMPLPREEEIVIYPVIPNMLIEMNSMPDTINAGTYYDNHRKGQDVTEVFELRDYKEGDSIKSIHWKMSEKIDRLIVREFGHPSNYQTVVYYDTDCYPYVPRDDFYDICDGILGMTDGISKGLLEQYHFHRVLTMSQGSLVDEEVSSMTQYIEMINNQMSRPISKDGIEHIQELLSMDVYSQFSKIILVTGYLDMSLVRQISETTNLTVVLITSQGQRNQEQGINYSIITIPLEDMAERVRGIEI